jgi:DNA-binding HxlR family transcriptional regulator
MQNLSVTNAHFITFKDDVFTIDVLGGVDLQQVERMICTLRITCKNYPPHRTTLDLYNDAQTEKLQRTLCDKWELKLTEASKSIYSLVLQLEDYRLQELKFLGKNRIQQYEPTEEETKQAINILKSKNLLHQLTAKLNATGILGEDENAFILLLALASYKFNNPFSVLCLAKNGIGKSYILQKLSECMPPNSYSFHTRISENALYYFDSNNINNKALIIEDLDWTTDMLQPLATLQTHGRLINTRATKDKDGLLHSTTFEVNANLCLVACAYDDKKIDEAALPFLCLQLNHSLQQDILVMDYQKKIKAGLIQNDAVQKIQTELKNIIATLQNVSVINPFATLINLPAEVACPRKSLLLLLNFIEVITYFFQYQREQRADKETGEVFVITHPKDIELAFSLLKNTLFKRADELSTNARSFYNWLTSFLAEAKTKEFTALDIRKAKQIHPRTLSRHLQELVLFSYIQVCGGNKHRGGFIYKLTGFDKTNGIQCSIEADLQNTMQKIWEAYNKDKAPKQEQTQTIEPTEQPQATEPLNDTEQPKQPTFFEPHYKRIRINEKEEHTFKILLELEALQQGREYLCSDITAATKRSQGMEARYLKTLWEQGKLNREWKNRQYYYTLATTSSETVSQNPVSNSQTQQQQGF